MEEERREEERDVWSLYSGFERENPVQGAFYMRKPDMGSVMAKQDEGAESAAGALPEGSGEIN
ncbi:unnamed protein product [Trifolium pratense]|uniref:Uncharacterized protein n=1 Tax=Trifolium pratense TaxID=57577 RepID=A0ACB0LBG5_TRIPR|nr:unnamed protein product [Trifolium pratense]